MATSYSGRSYTVWRRSPAPAPGHLPPSQFPVLMLNRLLNAGTTHVNGVDLLALLGAVGQDGGAPESVQDDAREFAAYQRAKG